MHRSKHSVPWPIPYVTFYRIRNSIWNYKSIYHISIYFSFLFIVTNPRKWNPIQLHIIRIYRWYIPPSESIARNIHSCTICNINSNPKPISIYSSTISKHFIKSKLFIVTNPRKWNLIQLHIIMHRSKHDTHTIQSICNILYNLKVNLKL